MNPARILEILQVTTSRPDTLSTVKGVSSRLLPTSSRLKVVADWNVAPSGKVAVKTTPKAVVVGARGGANSITVPSLLYAVTV